MIKREWFSWLRSGTAERCIAEPANKPMQPTAGGELIGEAAPALARRG
jgi:hypothetical protein